MPVAQREATWREALNIRIKPRVRHPARSYCFCGSPGACRQFLAPLDTPPPQAASLDSRAKHYRGALGAAEEFPSDRCPGAPLNRSQVGEHRPTEVLWLTTLVLFSTSELGDRVSQQSEYDNKYDCCNCKHQE